MDDKDLKGRNVNIIIKPARIPGAREVKVGETINHEGVFIPIDNRTGVCIDSYIKKLPDGGTARVYLEDIELHIVGVAFTRDNVSGATHGLKPCVDPEVVGAMLEHQKRSIPWIGFLTPWSASKKKTDKKG